MKVLISLTHDNLQWCNRILSNDAMLPTVLRLIAISHYHRHAILVEGDGGITGNASDEKSACLLDQLCLALGLFTNLVQVDDVKSHLADISASSSCPMYLY